MHSRSWTALLSAGRPPRGEGTVSECWRRLLRNASMLIFGRPREAVKGALLEVHREQVQSGLTVCPLSDGSLLEVLRQSDLETRTASNGPLQPIVRHDNYVSPAEPQALQFPRGGPMNDPPRSSRR